MKTVKMSRKSLATKGENYANAIKALEKGVKYTNSLDGAFSVIVKQWTKGYKDVVLSMDLEYKDKKIEKPGELAKYFKALIGGDGLNALMSMEVETKKNGKVSVPCLYTAKSLEDKSVEPIKDAKGRDTYPYIMTTNEKGDKVPVKVDCAKPISKYTPEIIFDFILQNIACNEGEVPFTEESYKAMIGETRTVLPKPSVSQPKEVAA